MTPTNLAETLTIQYTFCAWAVNINLKDLSHTESLVVPTAGNSVNWILGHILHARNSCLALMGAEGVLDVDTAECFARGSTPETDPDKAIPLDTLLVAFQASQVSMLAGLPKLTVEQLEAPAPFSPGNDPDETVGSLLAGLAFHEAYHVGQLGVLRRLLGHEVGIR